VATDGIDFDALYRHYYPGVRGLILRSVHDPRIADDLAQETFLRFWRALPKLDLSQPIWPWLVTVARRAASDATRPKHEATSDASEPEAFDREDLAPGPEERALDNELTIATLRPLNQRHKRVLFLRYVVGWTQMQIAEYEQSSPRAVNMTLVRAREAAKRTRDLPALVWLPLERIARRVRRATARIQSVAAELVAGAASYVGAGIFLLNRETLGAAVLAAGVIGAGVTPTTTQRTQEGRAAEVNPSAQAHVPLQTQADSSGRVRSYSVEYSPPQTQETSFGSNTNVKRDERSVDVTDKIWSKVPDEYQPRGDTYNLTHFYWYCEKATQQAVCDGLDALP
jgi:RNA polymerase sigma-70 factor (ECF subfamily)